MGIQIFFTNHKKEWKVMDYYTSLILLAILTLGTLIFMIASNQNILREKRKGFIIAMSMAMIGAFCEWIGIQLNGKFGGMIPNLAITLHYLVKMLELAIVPVMGIVCARIVFKSQYENRWIEYWVGAYIALELTSPWTRLIFWVDENNVYHHGDLYFVYIATFIVSTLCLFVEVLRFSEYCQNRNIAILIELISFTILGVSLQLANQETKTCWITVAILGTFIHSYYIDLNQYLDPLTYLLNRKSFDSKLNSYKVQSKVCTIVFIDLNDFSKINNHYGHLKGDECLKEIANILRKCYSRRKSWCYRYGGDEFAIIIDGDGYRPSDIRGTLNTEIIKSKKTIPELPFIAVGVGVYSPLENSIKDAIKLADSEMYKNKSTTKRVQRKKVRFVRKFSSLT